APCRRPRVIRSSRRMRLPSTTPHPASRKAGSTSSARVSASFMGPCLHLPQRVEVGAHGAQRQALRVGGKFARTSPHPIRLRFAAPDRPPRVGGGEGRRHVL